MKSAARRWTEEETLLALSLYLQTPFGKIHDRNPEIISLAEALERSAASLAMKMSNLAGLNPKILSSGRVGLQNYSKLDQSVWDRFSSDWRLMAEQAEIIAGLTKHINPSNKLKELRSEFKTPDLGYETSQSVVAEQRRGQEFFRRAVMANFKNTCCITGIAEPKLLIASHIVPWKDDIYNRLNPSNGLALSATFDKAFDKGLLTITPHLEIKISNNLLEHPNFKTRNYFEKYHLEKIAEPDRYHPEPEFIRWHNDFFERQVA